MRRVLMMKAATVALLLSLLPATAMAFCGFFVAGGGADLFNNATQVVLMRAGTRTVLSMQNNYEGPVEDFAMVVPVPVVLDKQDVKTLPATVFDRVDQLSAPRLVEYWEQDPCQPPVMYESMMATADAPMAKRASSGRRSNLGVTIEAKFTVGEYKILILSARDSNGLETWLKREKYRIPEGAEPLLRPYVESGMKFFVAKVDVKKVKFKDGMAQLSPLRFHYDSQDFSLPIRLGMVNSAGVQDLIVHILSPDSRYVVSNYDNISIPTNLDLAESAKPRFGEFYAALFDDALKKHPGAVVTEYAWDASTCDPCPIPALTMQELQTLGADVLWAPPKRPVRVAKPEPTTGPGADKGPKDPLELIQPKRRPVAPPRILPRRGGRFILTRLHARYGKGAVANDLVFEKAKPVAGGREHIVKDGVLEEGAVDSPVNNFQARYAIRHPWKGPIECENPMRNRWGGPPNGGPEPIRPATDLAFQARGKLATTGLVERGNAAPQFLVSATGGSTPTVPPKPAEPETPANPAKPGPGATPKPAPASTPGDAEAQAESDDCAVSHVGASRHGGTLWLGLLGLVLYRRRRKPS